MFNTSRTFAAASLSAVALTVPLTVPSLMPTAGAAGPSTHDTQGVDCTGWQHKEFPTSGWNTDVWVYLCVAVVDGDHIAWGVAKWQDGGGLRKFDNFDVKVRLERYDADYDTHRCDYTGEINGNYEGSKLCGDATSASASNGGWTADGVVYYDLDADGRGGFTWQLHGSAMIE